MSDPTDELIVELDKAAAVMAEEMGPSVDDLLARKPDNALRQPEWSDYMWRLEKALRAKTADLAESHIAMFGCGCPAPYDGCDHDEPMAVAIGRLTAANIDLGRENDRLTADLAEARAAAPQPLVSGVVHDVVHWPDPEDGHEPCAVVMVRVGEAEYEHLLDGLVSIYPKDQTPPAVTRDQIREALTTGWYAAGKTAPNTLDGMIDAVWALLSGEGEQ